VPVPPPEPLPGNAKEEPQSSPVDQLLAIIGRTGPAQQPPHPPGRAGTGTGWAPRRTAAGRSTLTDRVEWAVSRCCRRPAPDRARGHRTNRSMSRVMTPQTALIEAAWPAISHRPAPLRRSPVRTPGVANGRARQSHRHAAEWVIDRYAVWIAGPADRRVDGRRWGPGWTPPSAKSTCR